jgi:hypothetical protein
MMRGSAMPGWAAAKLHLADDGRWGCGENPCVQIGAKPALRNWCEIKAEVFGAVEQLRRKFEILIGPAAVSD